MKTKPFATPYCPGFGSHNRKFAASIVIHVMRCFLALALFSTHGLAATPGPGSALQFDGTNGVVLLQNPAAPFPNPAGEFTIEFWAKPTALRDASAAEGNSGTAGTSGQRYAIFPDDGGNAYGASHASVGVSVGINGVAVFARGTAYFPPILAHNVSITNWTHIAVVVQTNRPRLYLNGTLVRTGVTSTKALHPSAGLGDPGFHYGHYQGQVDEIRIWKLARTASEIQAAMNLPLPENPNLVVLYYRLDEGSGDVITNATLESFDGQRFPSPAGFPAWVPSTAPVGVPLLATIPATQLQPDRAQLNAVVQPHGLATTAWFEWGGTTNYGNTTPPAALGSNFVSSSLGVTISNLAVGATYHFRAVASNSVGVVRGTNATFQTPFFGPIHSGLPLVAFGSGIFADMDTNGTLDVTLVGVGNTGFFSDVWLNSGGTLNRQFHALGQVQNAFATVADIDNDGRMDLSIMGSPISGELARLYRNTEGGMVEVAAAITQVRNGGMDWGDYDNDGLKDLALSGFSSTPPGGSFHTTIWRNTGSTVTNINAGLPGLTVSAVAWGDYDNDGLLDLAIQGGTGGASIVQIWRNNGTGFTNINAGLTGMNSGDLSWGDYDNDGRLDLLVSGFIALTSTTEVWRNTGAGFTNIQAAITGADSGSFWGDYNNDGRLDVVTMGTSGGGVRSTRVWQNNPDGFVQVPANLPAANQGTVAWGDYDRDGRLDILQIGYDGFAIFTDIWRNGSPATNTAPSAPAHLTAQPTSTGIQLAWYRASDAQTPSIGLTHNIRVGTTPGSANVVGPEANLSTGQRFVARMGNAQMRTNAFLNLPPGRYYWSVQGVDTAFEGGPWAPEQSFDVGGSRFTKLALHEPGTIQLTLAGYVGRTYAIKASADISAPPAQWQTVTNVLIGSPGVYEFTVPNLGEARYFRAEGL
ncbi:MAG TPA: FG-GAP-like repeat-containing protein [Verrucomicrobiae bacterium]|nr:FG-GAP-like repeat-containing protein [Verrucomicrobiae bacterium]